MNNFNKFARRNFSLYHHNLEVEGIPSLTKSAGALVIFETLRITLYMYLGVKLILRFPSFLLFNQLNFKKARNNPDFMLCDEKTFKELNKHK